MSEPYHELLDATVRQLEHLKADGTRFVNVSSEALQELRTAKPLPRAQASQNTGYGSRASQSSPREEVKVVSGVAVTAPPATPLRAAPASNGHQATAERPEPVAGDKGAAMAAIRERATQCVLCPHLVSTRKSVVFGVGSVDAEIMFVGEAPGADEDVEGEPFVGLAGQLLTKMIQTMGLSRSTVYIANILKCRPDMPVGSSGNRKPRPEEMQTCIPYLHAQIDIIKPKVLVALGATAMEGLVGKGPVGITKLRGQWHTYRGIPLMPTYHPAYLLRNQAISEKRRVWEDLLAVMEKVSLPITDKQRGFFLKR